MLPQSHINNMSDDYLTNSSNLTNSNLSSESNKLFENESNSEMDTTTSTLYKPKRPKFIRIVPCQVCGDDANDHNHYGGKTLYKNRGLKLGGFPIEIEAQISKFILLHIAKLFLYHKIV